MDDDDFVEKMSQDSGSKLKSVSKSDAKFVQPQLVAPKKARAPGKDRVSESENSTAVGGQLTETDESALLPREVTSAKEVIASQSCVRLRMIQYSALQVRADQKNGRE